MQICESNITYTEHLKKKKKVLYRRIDAEKFPTLFPSSLRKSLLHRFTFDAGSHRRWDMGKSCEIFMTTKLADLKHTSDMS